MKTKRDNNSIAFSRRKFLTLTGSTAIGVTALAPLKAVLSRKVQGQAAREVGYGTLAPQFPENAAELVGVVRDGIDLGKTPLLQLPHGFRYTAFSITGQPMSDGQPVPSHHDGMAAFPGSNGTTILIRNHELNAGSGSAVRVSKLYDQPGGGTTTVVMGDDRHVIKHWGSLGGTVRNCAGGLTPWGSWISCEETLTLAGTGISRKNHGYNFEVPVTADIAVADPIPLVAMGRFNHEAIAVDPVTGWVYQTEDEGNSCFYRFRPNVKGNLQSGGVLEALVIVNAPADTRRNYLDYQHVPLSTSWVAIDTVDPDTNAFESSVRGQAQAKGAAIFARGEGAWCTDEVIYFSCTNGGDANCGQIFAYHVKHETLTLVIESPGREVLDFPDNITVAPFGDLIVCEDGDRDNYIVGINQAGELYHVAKNNLNSSEYAGACFSPDGSTLFVNIQIPGITLAIWGDWNRHS